MKKAMKRKLAAVLAALLLAGSLAGCESYPEKDSLGNAWNRDWTILGRVLGVEEPGHGLTLLENPVVLTGSDTFYASWTIGDPTPYTNEDGEETDLYEAQLYLLVYGCADEENARAAVADWTDRESALYDISDTFTEEIGDQSYDFFSYTVYSDTNPYARGTGAFAVRGSYALSAELTAVEGFTGDTRAILEDFLAGCHYSAD